MGWYLMNQSRFPEVDRLMNTSYSHTYVIQLTTIKELNLVLCLRLENLCPRYLFIITVCRGKISDHPEGDCGRGFVCVRVCL